MSPHSIKVLTIVLRNCLFPVFIHLKLELLTQYPVSNDENYLYLRKNKHVLNYMTTKLTKLYNICTTFVQRRTSVFDVSLPLYKNIQMFCVHWVHVYIYDWTSSTYYFDQFMRHFIWFVTCLKPHNILYDRSGIIGLLRLVKWHCLQAQDAKFEPWRSEAEHANSRSGRRLTILNLCEWGEETVCFFETWIPEWVTIPRSPTF